MKKASKEYIRKQADKALQDYIRAKHKDELCWVCGERPITCGHHFYPVSNSNATRYYIPNLIPICKECHSKVHTQPHLVHPTICFKLGQEWEQDLLEVKQRGQKFTKEWVETNLKILQELLAEQKG